MPRRVTESVAAASERRSKSCALSVGGMKNALGGYTPKWPKSAGVYPHLSTADLIMQTFLAKMGVDYKMSAPGQSAGHARLNGGCAADTGQK